MKSFLAACSLAFVVVGARAVGAAAQDDEVVDITGESSDGGGAENAKAGDRPLHQDQQAMR